MLIDQAEVDLATIQINPAHLHPHPGADGVANAGALTAQLLSHLVELEVFTAQLGHMDQPLHIHGIQGDEDAKAGGRRDHAREFLTQMLAHVLAFEPCLDIPAGLIGAAFIGTAMQAGGLPAQQLLATFFAG